MSPNKQLVQYIENEAFKGRHVADILVDVRKAGWSESQIQLAVRSLNQEHDVLQQLDLDPLHRRVHKRSMVIVFAVAVITALIVLVFAAVVRSARRPELFGFADTNYSLRLPADWYVSEAYIPGALETWFFSSEARQPGKEDDSAVMTMYADADRDTAGGLIRDGGSRMQIVNDETLRIGKVTYRIIEFRGIKTGVGTDRVVQGLYAFIDKGNVKMSATITSDADKWGGHAGEARAIMTSIVPECSRRRTDAKLQDDGTIMLCGL